MPLRLKQDWIQSAPSVRVLGVVLDQRLRFREHLASKTTKAYKAASALKRLHGLRASNMRQLFNATVAPVMDHASPIWYLVIRDSTLKNWIELRGKLRKPSSEEVELWLLVLRH